MAEHLTEHGTDKLEISVVSEFEVHTLAGAEYGSGIESILPSNTLIKVITPEELEILQPLLVNNGVVASVFEDIKAHVTDLQEENILIQNGPVSIQKETNDKQPNKPQDDRKTRILAKAARMEVLPITCKNTLAHLHKDKFGSGNRGKCIKYRNNWFTPREFEIQCGRASSNHWRRTIRFEGITLEELTKAGVITTHSLSCSCCKCFDDEYAVYPVKLSPPSKKRRSRHLDDEELIPICKKSEPNRNQSSPKVALTHDKKPPARSTETDQTGVLVSVPAAPNMAVTLRRLDNISRTLIQLTTDLKQCITDVSVMRARQLERLRHKHVAVVVEASGIRAETDKANTKNLKVAESLDTGDLISMAYTGA